MAEELLDGFEVSAAIEEVGREAVSEGVGGEAGREVSGFAGAHHDRVHRTDGEAATFSVGEEGGSLDGRHTFGLNVVGDGFGTGGAEDDHPFLRALAPNPRLPGVEVDLGEIEGSGLGDAEAGTVEEFEQRAFAGSGGSDDEVGGFVGGDAFREGAPADGRFEAFGGIGLGEAVGDEVLAKGAEGGELTGAGRRVGGMAPQVESKTLGREVRGIGNHGPELGEVGGIGADGVRLPSGCEMGQESRDGLVHGL